MLNIFRKMRILFRLFFYITYLSNIQLDFLTGYTLHLFNLVVYLLVVLDIFESYKELKTEKRTRKKAESVVRCP